MRIGYDSKIRNGFRDIPIPYGHAACIIVSHNHPTGDPCPSFDDKSLTQKLEEVGSVLGIPLLDHIIIGDGCYVSLLEKGLIRQKESQNGHKEYFIVNSYIYLWYAFVYTARLKADYSISDQTIIDFDEKLRKEVYRRFFRTTSLAYLHHYYFKNWSFDIINDELHQDVTIDKVNFDYVGEDKYLHRTVLFKCGLIKTRLVKKALRAMKQTPFHEKEYVFLFTNKSIPRGCWTIAKTYDNVHIIQEKSLYRLKGISAE